LVFLKKKMRSKFFLFIIILIFIIIFLIFYKGLTNYSIYTPKINIENDIPVFSANIFDSDLQVSSKELFDPKKSYLLNIWSSWCVPCRDEHALLMDLSKDEKVNLIGLNYKDRLNNAKNYLNELGNPYSKILVDETGTIAIEWGAFGVPETFLIYENKVIKKYIGPLNQQFLIEIKSLIK